MPSRYARILVATDFSTQAEDALKVGAVLAQRAAAEVTLLHVFDPSPYMRLIEPRSPQEAEQAMGDSARRELERLASEHLAGVERVRTVAIRHPSAAVGISKYAGAHQIELCVLATRGRTGLTRILVGSVAERIVRHAPCDVLVVRGEVDGWSMQTLLAPTDFSEVSAVSVRAAAELHESFGAKVALVHVYDDSVPTPAPELFRLANSEVVTEKLRVELEQVRKDNFPLAGSADDEAVSAELLIGDSPADAICSWAGKQGTDLIVLSSHGRTGLAAMLIGSVAEQVVRHAPCPVLTVRAHPREEEPGASV